MTRIHSFNLACPTTMSDDRLSCAQTDQAIRKIANKHDSKRDTSKTLTILSCPSSALLTLCLTINSQHVPYQPNIPTPSPSPTSSPPSPNPDPGRFRTSFLSQTAPCHHSVPRSPGAASGRPSAAADSRPRRWRHTRPRTPRRRRAEAGDRAAAPATPGGGRAGGGGGWDGSRHWVAFFGVFVGLPGIVFVRFFLDATLLSRVV